MRSIYIAGGCKGNTAVNILKGHLEAKGHRVTRDAKDPLGWDVTLRWGVSYHGDKPSINARVNEFDKYNCFMKFKEARVCHPFIVHIYDALNDLQNYPDNAFIQEHVWLARKRHHVKGKDIKICKTRKDVAEAIKTHDFFSVFTPTQTEYRVWVFQDKVFGIYEKTYKGEGEYVGFMRNRRFGFKFEKRDNLRGMKEIEAPCVKAVKSLGLDFGAVDLLLGKDGKFYVLENNTMPNIDSPNRSSGIRLANLVSEWAEA